MLPPCSSTIFFTIASPSPVPPCLPAVTNDWNSRPSISLGMPGPGVGNDDHQITSVEMAAQRRACRRARAIASIALRARL